MHVVATVRLAELKISKEEFIAPGERFELGCSEQRFTVLTSSSAFRQTPPDCFSLQGNCSLQVTGRLDKTQEEICGAATGHEKTFLKQLAVGVDMKAQIAVKHLSAKVVRKSETSATFIYSSNTGLLFLYFLMTFLNGNH